MDFFKRLFSPTIIKSYLGGSWTTVYPSGVTERQLLDNNKEWVFIAVDQNANSIASVRFKVMRYQRNGDDQEVFNGPMAEFLENPARGFTGKDFLYLHAGYKELTGNAFWEILPTRTLKPLIPTAVTPKLDNNGALIGYRYTGDGKERSIALDKVLHDKYVDFSKPNWGVGKLEKIARWVDTSSYANEFLKSFFINGATFGGFIETEEESEERIKLIKAGLANDHVGVANAHKIAVLPKGGKFAPATANMAEMQFGEMDDRYRDKILAGFGVPKTLVGFTTEVNRASAEASEYIYAKYTIKPMADKILAFLNSQVAPLFDSKGEYYFAYDEFVPENMEIKLKERELSLNKQAYRTVNEVRAELGLPPVEGGDTVYNSAGLPLGEKPLLPAAPGDKPGENGDKSKDKPGDKKKSAPYRARALDRKESLIEELVTKAAEIAEHVDFDAENHKAFVVRVGAHEKALADEVRAFNKRQEKEVQGRLGRLVKAVTKQELFEMDSEVGALVDVVTPLLKGILTEQAIEEYLAQQFEGELDAEAGNLTRIVELAAKRLARSYNDTTATLLKKALDEGIDAGESTAQLAARIAQVYDFSDSVRAEAVARTESFYIANEGSREAYRQSGVVKSVRWYTAEDERVCPFCGPMNGKIIGINEVFFEKGYEIKAEGKTLPLNYREIDVPPLHTNCRCFIRPEQIEV